MTALAPLSMSIFDGGQGTDNSLVVGDFLFGVEGDVEIDLRVVSIDPL